MGNFRNTEISKANIYKICSDELTISLPTDSTVLAEGQLVKLASGKLVAAAATDKPIGFVVTPLRSDDRVNVMKGCAVIQPYGGAVVVGTANATIAVGDEMAATGATDGGLTFKKAVTGDAVTGFALTAAAANSSIKVLYIGTPYTK